MSAGGSAEYLQQVLNGQQGSRQELSAVSGWKITPDRLSEGSGVWEGKYGEVFYTMEKEFEGTINAYLLRQADKCPLRLQFILDPEIDSSNGIPYKYEMNIMMRRTLGLLYPGGLEAGHDHEKASKQTREWLEDPEALIYGGVAVWKNFHARFPVMKRSGDHLKLFQLHGKLWKSGNRNLRDHLPASRQLRTYLKEAVYKRWIINKAYPGLKVSVSLCFPSSDFYSKTDNLYEEIAFCESDRENVSGLFTEIDAGSAMDQFLTLADAEILHPFFFRMNLEQQLNHINDAMESGFDKVPFVITDSCKMCQFRSSSGKTGRKGCWEMNLNGSHMNPQRHLYELPGSGNRLEAEKQNYFQEEVSLPAGMDDFDSLRCMSTSKISMQQRRTLQLLTSRNRQVPTQWLKKNLADKISDISYPLHFLDFEAAASPVPMARSASPYTPVFFQFSCHSLDQDGELTHHSWLDRESRGYPHRAFAERLTEIPGILTGTIVQYSPFEKQAIGRLCRELETKCGRDDELALKLRRVLSGSLSNQQKRFLDMNKLTRNYYYNREMNAGLSLKQVLFSTLKTSRYLQVLYEKPLQFGGDQLQLVSREEGSLSDPYSLVQKRGVNIADGSSAMYAWLHTKTPYCDEEERESIHSALKNYCMLDTLALVMIFQHWSDLIRKSPEGDDIIVWDEPRL